MREQKKKSTTKAVIGKKKSTSTGIELSTVKLKEMVSRAVKGASSKSILPITAMMAIELKDNKLTLTTTDYTNYLYIIEDKVPGDDFYAVVLVDTFSKLISRMSSEKVKLVLKPNALEVTGNGKYLIDLQQEDDGSIIRFPNPIDGVDFEPLEDGIQLTTIHSIINTAKSSLAVTMEAPYYTGYYCGDRVVATDTMKMCSMDIKLWDEPRLISPELMNLLAVMTTEEIGVDVFEDQLVFTTPDCIIYGRTMEGIEDYAIDDINAVLDKEFESKCKLKKSNVLQLLDRLSLFVSSLDKNVVDLHFIKDGVQFSSKALSGVETIEYVESENFEEFSCSLDIVQLSSLVKSLAGDAVELFYGDDALVKIVEGNTTLELCLVDEDYEEDDDEEAEESEDVEDEVIDDDEE